ncbi:MAG: helix-turn-helix transcriptional regulator [Oscillospiraceae bacterium]|nr:helix-turn-helix transcriptional regulator [Oscillospiraceae bacterium]
MNSDFPRILSLLRKERHISQKDAAAALGVAQALLSHYEKGKRECGLDFLVRAADYYNVSTDYLLGRSPMSTGSVIMESQIPDAQTHEKARFGADISITLSKKLLTNSIEVIYSILSRIGNSKLNNAVTNILNFTVYKVFRIIYRTNPKNSDTMFEIGSESACRMASAGAEMGEGAAAVAIKEAEQIAPEISTVMIETDYPKQAPALLSLIKSSENQLKKLM